MFPTINTLTPGCNSPPADEYVTSSIAFSHVQSEYWSYTEVEYECVDRHSFEWGENGVRVCGSDGKWNSDAAPICEPGYFNIINNLY